MCRLATHGLLESKRQAPGGEASTINHLIVAPWSRIHRTLSNGWRGIAVSVWAVGRSVGLGQWHFSPASELQIYPDLFKCVSDDWFVGRCRRVCPGSVNLHFQICTWTRLTLNTAHHRAEGLCVARWCAVGLCAGAVVWCVEFCDGDFVRIEVTRNFHRIWKTR